jgi:hypothetical protein
MRKPRTPYRDQPCNRALGFFNDDPKKLLGAIVYLTEWLIRATDQRAECSNMVAEKQWLA